MYNQGYEDYMRNVLGYNPRQDLNSVYQPDNSYVYQPSCMQAMPMYQADDMVYSGIAEANENDIEKMYPDIYYIINPMILKKCSTFTGKLTEVTLREMVDEIYYAVEQDEPREDRKVELKNGDVRNPNAKETRTEDRRVRPNNFLLRDLIQILILKNLLGGGRPPFRPNPPRPPMPPRPPFPGGNIPPIRPRYTGETIVEPRTNPYSNY